MEEVLKKNTKVLLLVAHPDDETIFCGGTMLCFPDCAWTVISMTDDGRPEAFINAIKNFQQFGVNIVSYKTLGEKNIPMQLGVEDLAEERKHWAQVLKGLNLNPEVVITHNKAGEYGHGAHKLLSAVADELFKNVWNFILPVTAQPYGKITNEVKLTEEILHRKTDIFNDNYPSELYIWAALHPLLDYECNNGPEVFTTNINLS